MQVWKMLVAACVLAACPLAAEAQQQTQMILGRWACTAITPDGLISAQMVYKADGTTDSVMTLGVGEGAESIEAIFRTKSTWRLPGDATLRELITAVDVITFNVDGKEVGNEVLGSFRDELMREELQSGSLQMTATSFTMVDAEGTRTSCVR